MTNRTLLRLLTGGISNGYAASLCWDKCNWQQASSMMELECSMEVVSLRRRNGWRFSPVSLLLLVCAKKPYWGKESMASKATPRGRKNRIQDPPDGISCCYSLQSQSKYIMWMLISSTEDMCITMSHRNLSSVIMFVGNKAHQKRFAQRWSIYHNPWTLKTCADSNRHTARVSKSSIV